MKGIEEFVRRPAEINQASTDELIRGYWLRARTLPSGSRLPFVLVGGLNWRESNDEPQWFDDGSICLRRPSPSGPAEVPSSHTTLDQQVWLWISADISGEHVSEDVPVLEGALKRVALVTDALSFVFDVPLRWYPAVHLGSFPASDPDELLDRRIVPTSKASAEMTNTVATDSRIREYFGEIFESVRRIERPDLALVMATALSWYSQGNVVQSGITSLMNYWAAVELLGSYFYKELPQRIVGRKSKSERKRAAIALLQTDLTDSNVFRILGDCQEYRRPTARTKLRVLDRWVTDLGPDGIEGQLFTVHPKHDTSIIKLRNDLAHGNVSPHHLDFVEAARMLEPTMKWVARMVIQQTVRNLQELETWLKESEREA